jgi:hypothetical protein
MGQYAKDTSVSIAKSKAEIEDCLLKYGASKFMSGWDDENAMIAFEVRNKSVKFVLPMPDKNDREFTHTPSRGNRRTADAQHQAWEQAGRQRWRALYLVIKAKLEAVECGIVTFEQEFLAHIISANGQTVGSQIIPMLEAKGSAPLMLE